MDGEMFTFRYGASKEALACTRTADGGMINPEKSDVLPERSWECMRRATEQTAITMRNLTGLHVWRVSKKWIRTGAGSE